MLEQIRRHSGIGKTAPQRFDHSRVSAGDPLAAIRDAPADRPFVVAQLGQSLDGRIATISGESRWISGSAALDHVHALRACVDGVLIGVGTAVSDDPKLTVRRVDGRHPTRVVIDPSGRLPLQANFLRDDGVRRIVIRGEEGDGPKGAEVLSVERATRGLCPRAMVRALFEKGIRRILVEGGARTISTFIDADAVDRLHILVAPVIIGSGKPGLDLTPIQELARARRPETAVHVLEGGEVLFDCDLRRCGQ